MALSIGQKVGDKIYAVPDYGLQSPASFNKLKQSGALKLGASQIRRASQLLNKLADRLPKPVKDAASNVQQFYAVTEEREQARLSARCFSQEQINEANRFRQKFKQG